MTMAPMNTLNASFTLMTKFIKGNNESLHIQLTVSSKIIRALVIILVIFPWFNDIFYHLMFVINSINPTDHNLTNFYFIKLH